MMAKASPARRVHGSRRRPRKLFGDANLGRSSSARGPAGRAPPAIRGLGVSVAQAASVAKAHDAKLGGRTADTGEARDNFASYWREVTRVPLLSAGEQLDLATRYAATRSPSLRERLVTANLRLVAKIAREFHARPQDFPDLVQEGNAGLMRAVERYDPTRGVKLSSYAAWWIRAYIMQYLMANARAVKMGTTRGQRREFVEGHLGVPDVSLDQAAHPDDVDGGAGAPSRMDLLMAPEEARPDVTVAEAEQRCRLAGVLADLETHLDARSREILHRRWLTEDSCRLSDIAEHYDVSRERIRQVEQDLLGKLRMKLRTMGGAEMAA
jgi:RNA polymerase sigma-32 factor